jgi:hypothetical protein
MRAINLLWIGAALLLTPGAPAGSASAQESLYDRLSGQDFIECWIDKSLSVIAKDKRIDDLFRR